MNHGFITAQTCSVWNATDLAAKTDYNVHASRSSLYQDRNSKQWHFMTFYFHFAKWWWQNLDPTSFGTYWSSLRNTIQVMLTPTQKADSSNTRICGFLCKYGRLFSGTLWWQDGPQIHIWYQNCNKASWIKAKKYDLKNPPCRGPIPPRPSIKFSMLCPIRPYLYLHLNNLVTL